MKKLIKSVTARRAMILAAYAASLAICAMGTGCSTFLLTNTYHDAATERAVFTPIRADRVTAAHLHPDGMLTVLFSGWTSHRNMQPGTERDYAVHVQTRPELGDPGVPTDERMIKQRGMLRIMTFDKTDIVQPSPPPPDTIPIPVRIVSLDELRPITWNDFAKKQVGPGVWIRTDILQILYVPAPEQAEAIPSVLAQSHGEYARTFPLLLYGYPIAMPVLVAVDIATLPIKAVAVAVFFVTWDGSMF